MEGGARQVVNDTVLGNAVIACNLQGAASTCPVVTDFQLDHRLSSVFHAVPCIFGYHHRGMPSTLFHQQRVHQRHRPEDMVKFRCLPRDTTRLWERTSRSLTNRLPLTVPRIRALPQYFSIDTDKVLALNARNCNLKSVLTMSHTN